MDGKRPKIMDERAHCIAVTANLGTLFEQYELLQDIWVNAFVDKIKSVGAQFVALHIQEAGGKNYREDMPLVKGFVEKIRSNEYMLETFTRSFSIVDTDVDSSAFTALGNVYLVHKDLHAHIWDFNASSFVEVTKHSYHDHETELVEKSHFFRRERFPQDYYPQTKWSRKGYCLSRWKLGDKVADFVNVHLFHDACNLSTLDQNPSVFASNRKHALEFVAKHVSSSQETPLPTFYFGDFNFRLAMDQIVKHFTTEGYELVEDVNEKGKKTLTVKQKDGDDVALFMSEKEFLPKNPSVFLEDSGKPFRNFDTETVSLPSGLLEFPVSFEPSYPYAEDLHAPNEFLSKRCPGWCDRILVNSKAMESIKTDENAYDLFGRDVCTGDHKPVQLTFDL
eukprot:m.23542 g.23542  ORF g.23542 m.23542 type:complete len:393 (-) comp5553_c0_seq1:369-1547(-)